MTGEMSLGIEYEVALADKSKIDKAAAAAVAAARPAAITRAIGARYEFHLAVVAQNLCKLAKLIPMLMQPGLA